jgi:hypothetical protein
MLFVGMFVGSVQLMLDGRYYGGMALFLLEFLVTGKWLIKYDNLIAKILV